MKSKSKKPVNNESKRRPAVSSSRLVRRLLQTVPKNWCDPLLTGPKRVIRDPPYSGMDIERVCLGITERMRKASNRAGKPPHEQRLIWKPKSKA